MISSRSGNVVIEVSVQQVVAWTPNTEKLRAQETQTEEQGTTKTSVTVSWAELGEQKKKEKH